jgi:hypothetical protein
MPFLYDRKLRFSELVSKTPCELYMSFHIYSISILKVSVNRFGWIYSLHSASSFAWQISSNCDPQPYIEAAFLRLVHLTHTPVLVRCTRHQLNYRHTVSASRLFGRTFLYSSKLAKCLPGHCDLLPTPPVFGHSTYRLIATVHTFATRLLIKYRGADKSLARPGREEATATEDFDVHISYL